MQFSKLFFSLCCMVALGASLVACSEDEELFDDSGSKVTLPVHRAFILNEGTQGANNATLSFYAPDGNADFIKDIDIKSDRFDFEPEITAKVLKKHARLYELPVSYYGREFNEGKKITWRDGIFAIIALIKYRFVD